MNAITDLFPCKKLRRSLRLENKSIASMADNLNLCPLGFFDQLPLELKFLIFTYLPVEDLSCLTITSKALRNVVEFYRNTDIAQKYIFPVELTHSTVPATQRELYFQQFTKCGLLLKRSTCLYATKDRLKLIESYLLKYLCMYNKSCANAVKCPALSCYGKLLHTVIAGWDDKECVRAFETIGLNTFMLRKLESVVNYQPGSNSELELQVRLFFRRVFLNHSESKMERAFWLNLILKPFPLVHQARVLFLLYGPMSEDDIQWYELCESSPVTKEQTILCFGDLSTGLRVLHQYSDQWSEDDVVSVIRQLVCSPEDWLPDNVAALLYLCGEEITVKVLTSKAINGRLLELANVIVALCVVCVRQLEPVLWTVTVLRRILVAMDIQRDRLALLRSVVEAFHDTLGELHEYDDPSSNSAGQDLQNFLNVQSVFMWEIINLAFSSLFTM